MSLKIKNEIRLIAAGLLGDARLMSRISRINTMDSDEGAVGRNTYVVGCPDYGNLGDHAIAYAEKAFLNKVTGTCPIMMYGPLKDHWKTLLDLVRPEDIICLQGGGNMGTLYEGLENERLAVIDQFKANRVILFPQTFSHGTSLHDRRYMRHMRRIYSSHHDLHLIARERMSYNRMREFFPSADVILTPDIVLSLPPLESSAHERSGLYLCFREDRERRIGADAAEVLIGAAAGRFGEVVRTDTVLDCSTISPEDGEAFVRSKIAELSQARLVVTDRIHGMIFCALSGTPCIALDNSNGKVGQEYEWLERLPYIRFARSVDEATEMIGAEAPEPGRFPSEDFSSLFDPLAEALSAALG